MTTSHRPRSPSRTLWAPTPGPKTPQIQISPVSTLIGPIAPALQSNSLFLMLSYEADRVALPCFNVHIAVATYRLRVTSPGCLFVCLFCSGVPRVFCKCLAAVYQQASGHLSHQRREEGKPEEVKPPPPLPLFAQAVVLCKEMGQLNTPISADQNEERSAEVDICVVCDCSYYKPK